MNNKQDGIGAVLLLVVMVLILGVVFAGLRVMNQASYKQNSESKSTSQSEKSKTDQDFDYSSYRNDDFGFSFQYPAAWGKTEVNVTDNTSTTDAAGKSGFISFDSGEEGLEIKFGTKDYSAGPKGPFPLSAMLVRGWELQEEIGPGKYYVNGTEIDIDGVDYDKDLDAIYVVEPATFSPRTEYSYAFNTKSGGLVLTVKDGAKLDVLKQLAKKIVIHK